VRLAAAGPPPALRLREAHRAAPAIDPASGRDRRALTAPGIDGHRGRNHAAPAASRPACVGPFLETLE